MDQVFYVSLNEVSVSDMPFSDISFDPHLYWFALEVLIVYIES